MTPERHAGLFQAGLVDLGVCDKGRGRAERMHRLRPENPPLLSDGRGFDSPHLHKAVVTEKGPRAAITRNSGLLRLLGRWPPSFGLVRGCPQHARGDRSPAADVAGVAMTSPRALASASA